MVSARLLRFVEHIEERALSHFFAINALIRLVREIRYNHRFPLHLRKVKEVIVAPVNYLLPRAYCVFNDHKLAIL